MKAAVLYGKEDVRFEDVPEKSLGPGELRIHIGAALTCGTDLKVFKRGYHARMLVPPTVFGHELAGTVCEVGPNAAGWKVGDRVVAANSAPCGACYYCLHEQENLCDDLLFLNGAYAERIVVPARIVERNLLRLKSETNFRDAALTEPLACVVQGMEDVPISRGQRVLVIGAGPIGLMFVALANDMGCRVTVAGRGESRLAKARQLGAETVVDVAIMPSAGGGAGDSWEKEIEPFDIVFEAVGKPEAWETAIRCVRKGGTVNLFGGCPAGTFAQLDTGLMHYSNLRLISSFHHTPRTIRRALSFIEKGTILSRDFVDGECPLSQLPELFKRMTLGNRAVKTLIHVSE